MERAPFFSVIVPVYNVEEYLEECVGSVLRQDFTDFELILVDDGSTDSSGALCDAFAARDPRVQVFHQKNQGQSAARNHGLQAARGEYILFLDSDDFYPQNTFLRDIHACCQERDVVCFNYARYTDQLQKPLIQFPNTENLTGDSLILELVKANAFTSSPCLKAIRRSLLLEHALFFEVGVLSEDVEWNGKLLLHAHSVATAPEGMYAYRVRPGSTTRTMSHKQVLDQCRIVQRMCAVAAEGSAQRKEAYFGYTAFQYCTVMINIHLCKSKISADVLRELRSFTWILRHDANRIVKLVRLVHSVLGFSATSWLLYIYFRLFLF